MLEGLSVETLGAGGVVAALLIGLILWKVVKLAIKVVLFVVVIAVAAVVVGGYVQHGRMALPVPDAP